MAVNYLPKCGAMFTCAICAWRGCCQKKFSVSGRDIYCPDFVRDFTLKEDEPEAIKEKDKGKKEPVKK
jgi:hypothetical protein